MRRSGCPAEGGGVWYTAQASGELGLLDPESGDVREIKLVVARTR